MSKYATNIFIAAIIMLIFTIPVFVMAQSAGGTGNNSSSGTTGDAQSTDIKIINPFKQNTIQGFIETIVNDILIPIGSVVAVLMIMWAGFLYVTARGNPAQITKAHDALKWAIIGAAILLGAWVISEAIQSTINDLKK